MEALAAFSLAASVLQVVDFGVRLVGNVGHVLDKGTSLNVLDVDRAAVDLKRITQGMKHLSTGINIGNSQDAHLGALASESYNIAADLTNFLSDLKIDSRCGQFKTIRHAFAILRKRAEVDALQDRMQRIRDELQFGIIVSIRSRLQETAHGDEKLVSYQKTTERTIQNILDGGNARSDDLEHQLDNLYGIGHGNGQLATAMHQETLGAIQAISRSGQLGLFPTQTIHGMGEPDAQKKRREKAVLDRLRFRKMINRYEEIALAHQETFKWIFEEDVVSNPRPWSNFRVWLREGGGIYWINGKAASGKSTLMKYIDRHDTLRELLSHWAGDEQLVISSYYFWHNGTLMQRALLGMLQGLLYQILEQRNDLIFAAFPNREQQDMYTLSGLQAPIMSEIKAAMSRLVRRAGDYGLKICLLIDGLDEFEGGDSEMADLATYLASLGESSHVKIVASSRPLAVFEEAFTKCDKLRLQDLTAGDITAYVNSNVDRTERMVALREKSPKEAAELVFDIVAKASGVFLWVKLVVRSLLEGLRAFDDIDDLKERLRELPPALEDLYRHMLEKVSPRYRAQASKLIQIVRHNAMIYDSPLPTLTLYSAWDKDEEAAIAAPVERLSFDEMYKRCREMDIKLRTRTSGLLEVQHKGYSIQDLSSTNRTSLEGLYLAESHVQFLHKSVTDFLDSLEPSSGLLSIDDPDFNPNVSLLRGYLMQLKSMHDTISWPALRLATTFARKAEETQLHDQTALVDQLDMVMWKLQKSTNKDIHWSESNPENQNPIGVHHDSYLSFCIQNGLYYYVEAAFKAHGPGLLEKPGRPLLDYVLCPWQKHESPVLVCNAELVQLLVSYGANVTTKYESTQLHQRFANYLMNTEDCGSYACARSIRIFNSLLKGGLDAKTTFEATLDTRTGDKEERQYSLLRFVKMVFIEREASPSAEGLMPQAWMTRVSFEQDVKDAADALVGRVADSK